MRVRFAIDDVRAPTDLVVDCPAGSEWRSLSGPLARHGLPAHYAYVDGVKIAPDSVLGMPPLVAGATITFHRPQARRRSRWSVDVVSGPAAGARFDVPVGRVVLGRGASADIAIADPEVSRRHAELEVAAGRVTVRDLGSANGTALDGDLIRLGGSSALRIVDRATAVPTSDSPTAGAAHVAIEPDGQGHLMVNVPPRPRREPPVQSLNMPGESTLPETAAPSTLSWITVLTPLLVAVPLALAYGPRLLIVTLLAPLAALIGWTAERIRRAVGRRRTRQRMATELAAAGRAIDNALAAERRDRIQSTPDVATVLAIAERAAPGVWQRRPGDADFLRLRIGTADQPATLAVRHIDGTIDHPTLAAAPVTMTLAGQIVGITGPRERVLALTRFLIAQLAVLHPPSHVELTVAYRPSAAPEWSWTRWLPQAGAPVTVAVVDGRGVTRADRPAIYLSEAVSDLPAECDAVVEVTGRESTRVRLSSTGTDPTGCTIEDVVPDLVPQAWVERCARALAPLRVAAGGAGTPATLPDRVSLFELMDGDPADPSTIEQHWRAATGPIATIGVTAFGPYLVDLRRDGPHVLVAGTTGAGKSELLRTLVASLALAATPDELAFVLIDYKGGAAFGECTALPHTVGVLSDLDQHMTERALTGLNAELRRRERLFAEIGAPDLDAYADRVGAARTVARLVIVVDEFATLVEELPDFVTGLVSIARRGRSLGVHLVLATQRPAGVVTGDIRANAGLRIALRVADPSDSTDVVGVPDAAGISARTPGRAIVRTNTGDLLHMQTARIGGPVSVRLPVVHLVTPEEAEPRPPTSGLSLGQLASTLHGAAVRRGVRPTRAPWTAPLPVHLTTGALEIGDGSPSLAAGHLRIGLIDRPAEQRHSALTIDLDAASHWLVAGGPASGKTTLVRTVIAQATASQDTATHLYVVTTDDALADAAALWQCGAVVAATDGRRLDRLFTRLRDEIGQRRRGGRRKPRLLLAIDGWGTVAEAAESVAQGRPIATLQRLLRDGPAAGLTVVITGDRAVLTSRISAYAANRVILRLDDAADYVGAGVSRRLVPADLPPGRGILTPAGDIVQVALPTPDLRELAALQVSRAVRRPDRPLPFRVEPLPDLVTIDKLSPDQPVGALWAPLGIGGDDLRTLGVDLAGRILLVAGGPRSGRTTVIRTIGEWLSRRDVAAVSLTRDMADDLARSERPTVFVADNAEAILGTARDDALVRALQQGRRCGAVLSGLPDTFAYTYRGVAAVARRDRLVLLLGPPAVADAELAGVRISKEEHPPAGRGVLVADGVITDIQVARTRSAR